MASMNKVILIGNLTTEVELKHMQSGDAVANFGLAVNRTYKNKNGELVQDPSFMRIVVWGKRAEVCAQYLLKGRPVAIEGRLQSRSWEAQDGTKRSTLEIIANDVQFLGSPNGERKQEPQAQQYEAPAQEDMDFEEPPF